MTLHRRAAKRDENEKELVAAARKQGAMVTHLSGTGVPDLMLINTGPDVPVYICETVDQILDVVNAGDPIALVEVKMPGKKLRPAQQLWHEEALR